MSVVADTHAAIWYVDAPHELSDTATGALDAAAATAGEHIIISATTLVEIHYLVEKNRVKASVQTRIKQELNEPDPMIIVVALGRRHTRFDPARCLCPICPTGSSPRPRSASVFRS